MEFEDYLTASQAAEILSKNSGKRVSPAYVRKLAQYGKLTPKPITNRLSLYLKSEVERYVIEDRGGKHEQRPRRTKQANERTKIMLIDSKYRQKKA